MKKRYVSLLLVFALLLGLAACGGAAGGAESSSAASGADTAAPKEDPSAGWTGDAPADADFSAVRANAKLILRADIALETQDFAQTCAALEQMTAAAGGYIESSGSEGQTGERRAAYTLRVPQEQFEACYAAIGETCHVVSANRWSEDVTEQYTDIEIRLQTLQTKHARLLALLDKAGAMEDVIALENALADCEYEIDSLSGEKRRYDSLVGFSTLSVSVRETQALTAVSAGSGFGAQLVRAAQTGLGGLGSAVRGLILLLVTLWPAVLAAAAAALLGCRIYRRKKQKQAGRKDETDP
ncbi:MAG: DUF4349 domain-containing protein [Agathobaculum sp.]|jgi:hypothetical protein|uniref:DUF4349 domain-containing protein n=1 Tax=Agathobaculum sp. TaxID=2048138 RepID=UPI003D8B4832